MSTEKLFNMDLIYHTINWLKGEILESLITGLVGLLITVAALLFWRYGNTPYGRALIIPLLVVGVIPFIMGISGAVSNYNKIAVYQKQCEQDREHFTVSEKNRVERFDNIFRYTYPMAIILVTGGAILFFILRSPTFKAISLAMMLLGVMTYFIDHFAKERADIYYQHIKSDITRNLHIYSE